MGCDIHAFVEVKRNGKWLKKTCELDIGRNYVLFGILADVRNNALLDPIKFKRGLPRDMSFELQFEYSMWGDDAHSESWLLLSEILGYDWDQTIQWDEDTFESISDCCDHFLTEIVPKLEKLGKPENTRLVFWFDS